MTTGLKKHWIIIASLLLMISAVIVTLLVGAFDDSDATANSTSEVVDRCFGGPDLRAEDHCVE